MVRVEIFGMALDENSKAPILILKDESESRVLPIWIGAVEAMSISMAINKVPFQRPMTHDLMLNVIADLGGEVFSVEIVRIEEGTFYAEIIVTVDGTPRRIDSRPSDAIALAVRAGCPMFVDEAVIDEAGAPFQGNAEAVITTEDSAKWMDELEKLSEDETKYKM